MRELTNSHRGEILLVDDDPRILLAYGRWLRREGYRVSEAASAEAVEPLLATAEFDLVLTDVHLPGSSGVEVLQAVHIHDPDLPVALISGAADLASARQAVELGAMRYLVKPIGPGTLRATVEAAVRVRRHARVQRHAMELYDESTSRVAARKIQNARLDAAIASVTMAFQPIVRPGARMVFAYEALVRTDVESLRRPEPLFAVAQELGRVRDLGRAIRQEVAHTIIQTRHTGPLFVNVHAEELEDDELYAVEAPLTHFASQIVLEITERAPLAGHDVSARLARLRELGFRLALDDLGAGYAGLSWFALLRPEFVKLDMSLVRGIASDPVKQSVVRTMITLCRELGTEIIAEGVEDPDQRDTLRDLGCDLLQGYLFAHPGSPFPTIGWPT